VSDQFGFDWILFDVLYNAVKFIIIAHEMVVSFVLPKTS